MKRIFLIEVDVDKESQEDDGFDIKMELETLLSDNEGDTINEYKITEKVIE